MADPDRAHPTVPASGGSAPRRRTLSSVGWTLIALDVALIALGVLLVLGVRGDAGSAYQDALADAMVAGPEDVRTDLWPLSANALAHVWPDPSDETRYGLVAQWTSFEGYEIRRWQPLRASVWVTPVPQLRERCRAFGRSGGRLAERISQYLGLPVDERPRKIVQLWAPLGEEHAFRPCPDPGTSDRSCELGLPSVPAEGEDPAALAHARWFAGNFAGYTGDFPMPWTRLGYTYDWGPDHDRHTGASEYVLREGTPIWVASIEEADVYCSAGPALDPPTPSPREAAP